MKQNVIDQLQELCVTLREQLMEQPEYRALISLERTIVDLSACIDKQRAPVEPSTMDVRDLDTRLSMRQGAEQVAEALADALQRQSISRPADHLPSHRVA